MDVYQRATVVPDRQSLDRPQPGQCGVRAARHQLMDTYRARADGLFNDLLQRGALRGRTASEAFYIKCDAETNPPELREAGQSHGRNRTGACSAG